MNDVELWFLVVTSFYLIVFFAMTKYLSALSDRNLGLQKKYMDVLFKAIILEEQVKDLKKVVKDGS